MDRKILESLQVNSCIPICKKEKDKYLKRWMKSIRRRTISTILGSPIIIIVLYVALNNNSELLTDKIWDGFIVIWALFIILYGMIENCYNILGLANSKNEEWEKYLIFIDKKIRGNLIGIYVIDDHIYHDKIKRQYGDYFRHFNAKSFATLIRFKSTNKYMLITEMDWVEGVDAIYNNSF